MLNGAPKKIGAIYQPNFYVQILSEYLGKWRQEWARQANNNNSDSNHKALRIICNNTDTAQQLAMQFGDWLAIEQQAVDLHDLLAQFDLCTAIKHATARQMPLQTGGYLVFDYTEAMTVIDVNSGNSAKTANEHNLAAAHAIAHALRLRNIGGLVAIDFIDVGKKQAAKNANELLAILAAADDVTVAPSSRASFAELGVVLLARRRRWNRLGELKK